MAQLAFVYAMARPREKVTIKEPVQDPQVTITDDPMATIAEVDEDVRKVRGFPHRFFPGHKTKTIPLGVYFTGPEKVADAAEIEKAKSRSLESSPEKDDGASSHWLRKQKSSSALMARTNSMELPPSSKTKKVKFPDMKKSASWAHFVEVSQIEAPLLDMEIPEQYVCDMSVLFLGQKFASGNRSRLYQGVYNDHDVAVKLLRLDCCDDSGVATRLERQFMQEVHCLSQLHHPNIVRFVAASWKPPVCCLIMEYVPGGSLRAFLRKLEKGSMPMTTVLSMALDVALGMEYLHSQGVVHRDLKSENLVLTEDLHLKLTDFGVGCLETECDLRSADTGTYRWMAPEMISHKHYSKKVDVYSFGIVLWELVTGLLPFQNMTPVQVAYAVVNKNLRPVIPEDCPSQLRFLMEDCWRANPERRPNFYQIVQILEVLDRSWTEEPYHQQYAKSILFG
jgi:tRNA A-37 threonylcarbamoyl transferase component Bud32